MIHKTGIIPWRIPTVHTGFSLALPSLNILPLFLRHLESLTLSSYTLSKCSSILYSQLSTKNTITIILSHDLEHVLVVYTFHIYTNVGHSLKAGHSYLYKCGEN